MKRPSRAAVREVREEAGIEARVVHDLGIIRFTRKNEDTRVQFFLMRYEASVGAAEKRTVMWVPFADAQRLLTHEDARELLLAAQPAVVANLAVAVSSAAAQTLLLKDYDSLTQALANNESLGDTRLNFFVGLVTAVLSGLVALALSESEKAQALSASVTLFAGISLLALGIVVLFRIIHRNSVTDGYRKDLDRIRAIFRVHLDMGGVLQSYRPFGHASNQDDVKRRVRFKLRRFGWSGRYGRGHQQRAPCFAAHTATSKPRPRRCRFRVRVATRRAVPLCAVPRLEEQDTRQVEADRDPETSLG